MSEKGGGFSDATMPVKAEAPRPENFWCSLKLISKIQRT
jgi:hypothetical protein